jgi:hypothetical protein
MVVAVGAAVLVGRGVAVGGMLVGDGTGVLVAGTAVGVAVAGFNNGIAEQPAAERLTATRQMEKTRVFISVFFIICAALSK